MNPEITSTHRPIDELAAQEPLSRIAGAIQPPLRRWLEGDAQWRPIKDALHGTWLGHSLHPLLTDVPIGAWTVTAVCDGLEVLGASRYREAGDVALRVGVAGAVAAAVTGLADWSDTTGEPQRLGLFHAALNSAAVTLYLASLAGRAAHKRGLGIAFSLAGYGLVTAAAYLGGELSTGMQLGVKHTAAPIDPPQDFVRVCDERDIVEGAMIAANANGVPLLLSRRNGTVRAVSGVCTHRGAPLADGDADGACIRCPWHASRFRLDDGRVVEGPATFSLADFEVRIDAGGVFVRPRR